MKVTKFTKDELLILSSLVRTEGKKFSQKGAASMHLKGIQEKLIEFSSDSLIQSEIITIGLSPKEAVEIMQDIKSNVMTGDVTNSKKNELEFVRKVWNGIFESEKSMFNRMVSKKEG